MAIKGKKKTQKRGSQARRRPTPAPRPEAKAPRIPWYRKPAVVTPLILVFVISIGAGAAVVSNRSSESKQKKEGQGALQTYVGEVRALLQSVDPIVSAMIAAGANEAAPDTLKKDAETWQTALEGALTKAGQIVPPPGAANVNLLLSQSIQLYESGAKTYAVAAELEDESQTKVLERAVAQVTQASSIWQIAITEIDAELADADMGASQIALPGTAPAPLPSIAPSPQGSDTEEIETGGGKKGGGKKKDED